jgi:histidine triad (HIT) family protein
MPARVDDCLFCKVVAGEIPGEAIASDERTLAVLDINPATKGHTVVIAREHHADLFDLPDEDLLATMRTARAVGEQMKSTISPDGFNILTNIGRAAWQSIFHFHLHVIPRYSDDPLQLPWVPEPADPEELAEVGKELRGA